MTNGFVAMNAGQAMGTGLVSFAVVYLATAATSCWLSRYPPPSMRYGQGFDPGPSAPCRELRESAVRVFVPGLFDPRRRTRSLRDATPTIPPGFGDADSI